MKHIQTLNGNSLNKDLKRLDAANVRHLVNQLVRLPVQSPIRNVKENNNKK